MLAQLKQRALFSNELSFGFRVGLLLLGFLVMQFVFKRAAQLPASSYEGTSLIWGLLRHSGGLSAGILLAVALAAWRLPRLRSTWLELPYGRATRIIVGVCLGILAWTYSTYDINLHFDQSHLDARLALVALAFLSWWRPLFVPFFLLLILAVLHQFHYPLGGDSVAEQLLLIQILLICWLGFCLHQVWPSAGKGDEVLFLVFIALAAGYWTCGFGKLRMNWISFGHLHHLLNATYPNGWLSFLSADQIAQMSAWLAKVDWPMRIVVLGLEAGALAFLWRRWTMIGLLAGWLLFHLGVVMMSGIFFWKWMLLEMVLLGLLLRRRELTDFSFFRPTIFLLSFFLIVAGKYVFRPANLSWFDSPVSYTFQFEGVTEDGTAHRLPPQFFAPYDYQFTLGSFGYLSEPPMIPVVWGAMFDRGLAERTLTMKSFQDVTAFETELNQVSFDPEMAEVFDTFVRTWMQAYQEREGGKAILPLGKAPPQLLTLAKEGDLDGQTAFLNVRVFRVTSLYDGKAHQEERRIVREIRLQP